MLATRKCQKKKQATCIGCAMCPAKLRRCTQQYLCSMCRQSPEYKILSSTQLQKRFGLSDDLVDDLQVGWIVNSVNPSFARQRVYFEKDVLMRIIAASSGLHMNDNTKGDNSVYSSDVLPGRRTEIQEDTRQDRVLTQSALHRKGHG